jgi:hypothetical protein
MTASAKHLSACQPQGCRRMIFAQRIQVFLGDMRVHVQTNERLDALHARRVLSARN